MFEVGGYKDETSIKDNNYYVWNWGISWLY